MLIDAGVSAAAEAVAPTGYGWALIKMIGALLIVCLLAYVLLRYGLRRLAQPRLAERQVRVLDRCQLSAGRALWLVAVGKRIFLVGDASGAINRLAEFDPADLPETPQASRRSFAELLRGKRLPSDTLSAEERK
ncbi:MAG: flagellar biosynthetic protein FliO [Deltaproteobacteria bacterium]|nr:flagellar biosynthetic protein FliO [Deltaproteobacteria bacterium]